MFLQTQKHKTHTKHTQNNMTDIAVQIVKDFDIMFEPTKTLTMEYIAQKSCQNVLTVILAMMINLKITLPSRLRPDRPILHRSAVYLYSDIRYSLVEAGRQFEFVIRDGDNDVIHQLRVIAYSKQQNYVARKIWVNVRQAIRAELHDEGFKRAVIAYLRNDLCSIEVCQRFNIEPQYTYVKVLNIIMQKTDKLIRHGDSEEKTIYRVHEWESEKSDLWFLKLHDTLTLMLTTMWYKDQINDAVEFELDVFKNELDNFLFKKQLSEKVQFLFFE